MVELENRKRFRYLSGVIKHLEELKKDITCEDDILKFEITFNGFYYYIKYEYRW